MNAGLSPISTHGVGRALGVGVVNVDLQAIDVETDRLDALWFKHERHYWQAR